MSTFLMIWLFAGLFAWNILFYTLRREWYLKFKRDYWSSYADQRALVFVAILPFMIGGPYTLGVIIAMLLIVGYRPVFYYKPEEI